MGNTAQTRINVEDLTLSVGAPLEGVTFMAGITERGPFNRPDKLITSIPQFERVYGGLLDESDFPLLVRRALERGTQVRVNRIGHYTNITQPNTLTATFGSFLPTSINEVITVTGTMTAGQIAYNVGGTPATPITFDTDTETTVTNFKDALLLLSSVDNAEIFTAGVNKYTVTVQYVAGQDPDISDITFTGSSPNPVAVQTTPSNAIVNNNGETLFTVTPKDPGSDNNNMSVVIANASNGDSNYFNLQVIHSKYPALNETYQNLRVTATDVNGSKFLDTAINNDQSSVIFTYVDLSSETLLNPARGTFSYAGGNSDHASIVPTDYTGDAGAATGIRAFDPYDDGYQLMVPEINNNALHTAASAYCASRQDMNYYGWIGSSGVALTLQTNRNGTNVDTRFTAFFGGDVIILHPVTGQNVSLSPMGDIAGIQTFSDDQGQQWASPAGTRRGTVPNVLGVTHNFGTPARFNDLNLLANSNINMIVAKNNRVYLKDAYTAQLANTKFRFLSIQRLILYITKALGPVIENYLQEPNTISTWRAMFNAVEPFFVNLVNANAITEFSWRGDQNVTALEESQLQTNNLNDIDNGIYKVNLFIKTIAPMVDIEINIVNTPTGTSFDVANELI